MSNKKITFNEYIDQVGGRQLADMLQITKQNVHKWRTLQGLPRPEIAYKLITLSQGKLSFETIFMPFVEKKLKGKKIVLPSPDGKSSLSIEFKF